MDGSERGGEVAYLDNLDAARATLDERALQFWMDDTQLDYVLSAADGKMDEGRGGARQSVDDILKRALMMAVTLLRN